MRLFNTKGVDGIIQISVPSSCCVKDCREESSRKFLLTWQARQALLSEKMLSPFDFRGDMWDEIEICQRHNDILCAAQSIREGKQVEVIKEVPAKITEAAHVLWLLDKIDIANFDFGIAYWDSDFPETWAIDFGRLSTSYRIDRYPISLHGEIIFYPENYSDVINIIAKRKEKIAEKRQSALNKLADKELDKKIKRRNTRRK